MTAFISPPPRLQFFTNAGVPMAGGLLYTYAAGTTTPLVTYTDSTGVTANTNPVILDSRGEASIWLSTVGYKFKLATPANVDVWTQDNITTGSSAYMSYTPAGTGAVTTTVQAKLRESVSVMDFGAVGNGIADDTAAIQAAIDAVYAAGGGEVFLPEGRYLTTAAIYPKFGVGLIGPDTYVGIGQIYNGASPEAKIAGVAVLLPSAAVTTACVYYDFQAADRASRPYGANLINIFIDSRNQVSGDCLYIVNAPAAQGPYNSGLASDSLEFTNCVFRKAPRYGAYVVSTAGQKINADFYNCRFAFAGSHGAYAYLCFDMKFYNCLSFGNTGDGMRLEGCATERVIASDFFNNTLNGLTLDGYDARYLNCAFENNGHHGVQVICSVSTIVAKAYRFTDCRFGTNGLTTDNTYDNLNIGSYLGAGITGIALTACSFGRQAASTGVTVRAEIYLDALPTQAGNNAADCFVGQSDLHAGNALCGVFWMQSTNFSSCSSSDGNPMVTAPREIPAWVGAVSPNVLLGATFLKTANVGVATLFGLSAGTIPLGRELWILIGDTFTTVKFTAGGNLVGNGGVNLAAPCQNKLLHLKNFDNVNWAVQIYG